MSNEYMKMDLPNGWKWVKLGDICQLKTGGTPSRAISEYYSGEIKWLVSGDVHKEEIFDCEGRITDKGMASANTTMLPPDSVMIALNGQGKTRGTVAILCVEATCNQSLIAMIPRNREELLPRFLLYQLQMRYQELRDLTGDSHRSGLNMVILNRLKVAIPPFLEQQRIARILHEQMAEVERARSAAQVRLEAVQALPAAYLQLEFPQPDETLPFGWKWVKLDDVCNIVRGSSPRPKGDPRYYGGSVPRLMVEDVTRDVMYVRPIIDFLTEEGSHLSRPMKKGDVVIVVSGAPGMPAILAVDACIHDGFVGLRDLQTEVISREFLFYFLTYSRELTDKQATGAIFRNLTTNQVGNIRIPLPQLSKQKEIEEKLSRYKSIINKARTAAEFELETINALPTALLHRAFNGDL